MQIIKLVLSNPLIPKDRKKIQMEKLLRKKFFVDANPTTKCFVYEIEGYKI